MTYSGAVAWANDKTSFSIRHWTVDDGLPQNRISAIAQTPDGYLWLGTWFGLVRFDGFRPVTFNRYNTPALMNDAVNALAVAQDGALWIGTHNGLLRFKNQQWKRFTKEDGLPENEVWDLGFDPGGELCVSAGDWVGHFPEGPFEHAAWGATVHSPLRKLVATPDGKLSVVIPKGLAELSDVSKKVFPWPGEIPSYDYARAIEYDGYGGWWLGTETGLWHRDGTNIWTRAGTNLVGELSVELLYRDGRGILWAQVRGKGLHLLNGSTLKLLPLTGGEHQPDATAFFEDREGNFWVGTDAGLFQVRPRIMQAFTRVDGLINDDVWSVSEGPDGTIWMATSGGLTRIRSTGARITPELNPWHTWFAHHCVTVDNSGTVWSDGQDPQSGGLLGIPASGGPIVLWNNQAVQGLYVDRENRLWAGTSGGVVALREGSGLLLPNLPKADVRFSLQAHDGAMWFASTRDGLFRWRDGELEQFRTQDGLADNYVNCIHEDPDGVLWIGTENGLSRFVPPRTLSPGLRPPSLVGRERAGVRGPFFTFTTAQGLFDNLINHILEDDDGFLWFSCNRGIFRIARAELNAIAQGKKSEAICAIFGTADGMLSSETNGEHQPAGCKARDGRLWFPTAMGVVVIDPKKLAKNEVPPPVVIEQVRADEQIVYGDGALATHASTRKPLSEKPGSSQLGMVKAALPALLDKQMAPRQTPALHLPPGRARVLEIRYTANTFVASQRARFKYRLDGYDSDWSDASDNRVALYTNLRPGDYSFHVRASNSHGVWNEAPASLDIFVAPHFYETRLFYMACAAAALLAVFGLHHRRLRILQRIERLEREQALQAERARIARDLHDDLGANLTGLALKADLAKRQLHNGDPAGRQFGEIAMTTRALVDSMRETVWALNPKHDTLERLARFLEQRVEDFVTGAGLRCRLQLPDCFPELVVSSPVRHQISLVVKEALHNAVKHAQAQEIQFQLQIDGMDLCLRIADDGCGFRTSAAGVHLNDQPPSPGGNGLVNMRQRIESLGGTCDLESTNVQGTVISIRVPLASLRTLST